MYGKCTIVMSYVGYYARDLVTQGDGDWSTLSRKLRPATMSSLTWRILTVASGVRGNQRKFF